MEIKYNLKFYNNRLRNSVKAGREQDVWVD